MTPPLPLHFQIGLGTEVYIFNTDTWELFGPISTSSKDGLVVGQDLVVDAAELKAFPSQVFLDMRASPNARAVAKWVKWGPVSPKKGGKGEQGAGQGVQLQGLSEVRAAEVREARPPAEARGAGRRSRKGPSEVRAVGV